MRTFKIGLPHYRNSQLGQDSDLLSSEIIAEAGPDLDLKIISDPDLLEQIIWSPTELNPVRLRVVEVQKSNEGQQLFSIRASAIDSYRYSITVRKCRRAE